MVNFPFPPVSISAKNRDSDSPETARNLEMEIGSCIM